jgi:nitroimidazol reductase NimA-like FMN-containing flavoprotein (pyridoxamine 5'-phosphate oxidase superfamily)
MWACVRRAWGVAPFRGVRHCRAMTDSTASAGHSSPGLRPRHLDAAEIERVLAADVPAHLATVDGLGRPHVIPIWFLWDGASFLMTSLRYRPHVARIVAKPAVAVCIDLEAAEREDGQRPNQQVRGMGFAEIFDDAGGHVTRRVTEKYLRGPGATGQVAARSRHDRVVIRLVPAELVAVASV